MVRKRDLLCCAALIVVGARGFASLATLRAPATGCRVAVMQQKVVEEETVAQKAPPEIPARWKKMHDCERPTRWREAMTEEDCVLYNQEV